MVATAKIAPPHRHRGASGGCHDRWPRPGLADQGSDELVLPHGMPASDAVLLGEAGKIADGLFLEAG